ncbi:cytochrome c oxidase subunit II [Microvirga sp. SRT01]|uniref:Cytochrome aa3 subunit 2 n=1 Tax=Sphingomonas longa TaxID=2778730 RepID=A0ABS2D6W6_9SPHN|nr:MULTISPECIES: cytochrome c oxidase subunit II [Alphaproteobacteria]MBM6576656.1 cytochrome c oxidase subunit II [Sphingomonas sp. BT552]MBR7709701.1 cytochrome c oxidase subunit II [Microvirga sp. SRT01]
MATLSLAGCNRHQSALAPFGVEASSTRDLTIILLIGAVVIAVAMSLLIRHAIRTPGERLTHRQGMKLVLWAGGVVPTILLFTLLVTSLPAMRPLPTSRADLTINVEGEQFWWRVAYRPPNAARVVSANEVRVPVGRTVALKLMGGDVIHSFWIPGLAGKMDMIPGRTNTLVVRATKPGRFRGVCTEFCGLSHALMAFDVVAMEPAAFDRWLAAEAKPAAGGNALFAQYGCGGCHAIRGTGEAGAIGPDLTHFGARQTLAAGVLPMTTANVASFIRHPEKTKPGVRMPAFDHMPPADAVALARYLQGLK